ncbi:response regulator transcription factor [Kibdelosporangium persicum]|uniref:Two-component system response regulator n=1 Tax=Kibdelosporangium persicum TaxID=2698649 RepID=A0ABX2EXA8_9PSEU|nr:response regulator transcription factor [Kibdelosporangium persicum]NRN63627.1 Two-component system response regulator [Kibdelosporangium persicum]
MRIVIAEDSAVLRDGLSLLLTTRGHEVLATVSTGEELLAAATEHVPDIAVVDVRMPPTFTDEGVRAALAVRKSHPSVGLLVFSQHIETRYAAELLAGGARGVGYLLKDRVADVSDFMSACERIAAGGTVLDPEVVTQVLGASRHAQDLSALTAREREVLGLMAEGRTNTAIAKTLYVTEGSVEKHISSIFAKLGLPPSDTDHRRVLAVLRYLSG